MVPSQLVLSTKEVFFGYSPSWQKNIYFGEVVFTTGMCGYVETLTDPSYCGQIVTFTYPLIGNYGVPNHDFWESAKIHATAVIISEACQHPSHYTNQISLLNWLKTQNIPVLVGVDTRALTKKLRNHGSTLGAICHNGMHPKQFKDPNLEHLVEKVSSKKIQTIEGKGKKIIVIDCGIKQNILRELKKYPFQIKIVPFDYDFIHEEYDGVFISNGPGNPINCVETIAIIRKVIQQKKPTFGICLGSQLIALAIGAKTYKLKFGHRSQNQPCFDLQKNKAILTSQNHGYAIDEKTLPKEWSIYFRNLNDHSVEGIYHKKDPIFSVQFHPESNPGPNDSKYLFEKFYNMVEGKCN